MAATPSIKMPVIAIHPAKLAGATEGEDRGRNEHQEQHDQIQQQLSERLAEQESWHAVRNRLHA